MAARIIAVANQKGGSGKTTVTMSLAGAIAGKGHKVLVVDADPQGTASQWAGAASEDKPFPASVISLATAKGKLHVMLKPMVSDYEYIVIDCPPSAEAEASQSALLISDVCLVPLQPTPADMWATLGIVKLVEKAQTFNAGLKVFGVANRVTNSSLGKQVLSAMAQNNIVLLDAKLGNRTSFQEATITGTTPQKMGSAHKTAANEVTALANELFLKMGW